METKAQPLWKKYFDDMEMYKGTPIYYAGSKGAIVFCLHGAGDSSLSFSCMAKVLKAKCRVVAFDFKGHGDSEHLTASFKLHDLIAEVVAIIEYISSKFPSANIVLVGHSMGGAIATKLTEKLHANPKEYKFAPFIKGRLLT
jgi:protein phosphatase methylesterase 1